MDATLQQFKGIITQIPPMYSSVKVKGRKLYEYAREGLIVERPSRQVRIDRIERTSIFVLMRVSVNLISRSLVVRVHTYAR